MIQDTWNTTFILFVDQFWKVELENIFYLKFYIFIPVEFFDIQGIYIKNSKFSRNNNMNIPGSRIDFGEARVFFFDSRWLE